MFTLSTPILVGVLGVIGALTLGFIIRHLIALNSSKSLEEKAKRGLDEANQNAKEIIFSAKEKADKILEEIKAEEKERLSQVLKKEERLLKREEGLEKELHEVSLKEKELKQEVDKIKENVSRFNEES